MTEKNTDQQPSEKEKKRSFFGRPWVSVVSMSVGVLGVSVTIVGILLNRRSRELTYWVDPRLTVVVRSKAAPELQVFLGNKEVKGDVSIAQVVVWNAGTLPIRKEAVLSPVKLVTTPPTTILVARLRKQTRSVVSFQFDDAAASKGVLGLKWNILEQNDGAVIELVLAGATSVDICLTGTIEGQRFLQDTRLVRSRTGPQWLVLVLTTLFLLIFSACGALGILYHLYSWLVVKKAVDSVRTDMFVFCSSCFFLVGCLYLLIFEVLDAASPPFDL